jgi:hypothetical protein
MSREIKLVKPLAGTQYAKDLLCQVIVTDWCDTGWPHSTLRSPEVTAYLFGGTGQPAFAQEVGTFPLDHDGTVTFLLPRLGDPNPHAITLKVWLVGSEHQSTKIGLSLPTRGGTITIGTPLAGTYVDYALPVAGNATGTAAYQAQLIPQTGNPITIRVGPGAAGSGYDWSCTFPNGPLTECTLRVTNQNSSVVAQETLNPPPPQ